jgi:hypothetical protein
MAAKPKIVWTQNWRGFHLLLSRIFDSIPLTLPFLLNSIDLILHERLRKALLELKQAPALVRCMRGVIRKTV